MDHVGLPFGEVRSIHGWEMALSEVALSGWSSSVWSDRDERQAEVAQLLQQAVQRGLVSDGAVDDVVPSPSG